MQDRNFEHIGQLVNLQFPAVKANKTSQLVSDGTRVHTVILFNHIQSEAVNLKL